MKTLTQIIPLITSFFSQHLTGFVWVSDSNGRKVFTGTNKQDVNEFLSQSKGIFTVDLRTKNGTSTKSKGTYIVSVGEQSLAPVPVQQELGYAPGPQLDLQVNANPFTLPPLAQYMVNDLKEKLSDRTLTLKETQLELKAKTEALDKLKDEMRELNHSSELAGVEDEKRNSLSGIFDRAMENPEAISTLLGAVGGLIGKVKPEQQASDIESNLSEFKKMSLDAVKNWLNTTSDEEALSLMEVMNFASKSQKLMSIVLNSLKSQAPQPLLAN